MKDNLKKLCKYLGENNKPTYVVMAIATVKGICRPIFTMSDKTENPETKKYTALREGLTELIAIPAYWACGEIAGKFGKKIVSKGMDLKFEKEAKNNRHYTKEAMNEMKEAAIKKGQKGLMFIGVCAAALFVIPAVCSLVIKPVMHSFGLKSPHEKEKEAKNKKLDVIDTPSQDIRPYHEIIYNRPKFNDIIQSPQTGMKVGGV